MSRSLSLKLVSLVILACYIVPYAVIGHIATWYGSFLFWCLAGIAVMAGNTIAAEPQAMIALADARYLFIIGLPA